LRYGNPSQVTQGEAVYTTAKSHSDAAIAGLLIALETKDAPSNLPFVQNQLASAISGLAEFCNSVDDIVSAAIGSGHRNPWVEIIKILPLEPLLKAISEGVAALYSHHLEDDALTKKSIQTQLEATRWPDFRKVAPAQ
jgi:hypothetical protein